MTKGDKINLILGCILAVLGLFTIHKDLLLIANGVFICILLKIIFD